MGIYNHFKTGMLLALLTALLLWVGSLFGTGGIVIAAIFVIGMNFFSYFYSDKIVLKMYRAQEVTDKQNRLYKISHDIAKRAKLPMPKVYVIPDKNANAFATGRNPKHAAVAATVGILELLNDEQLKGVMAHEFAHIKNRDTLISTVAGMIAGIIGFIGSMAQWSAIFGMGSDDNGNNLLHLLVLAIITPIIATLIQLAISRSREYLADATGASFLSNPHGLAEALALLEKNNHVHPMHLGSESTAHLFISNPFKKTAFSSLFSTHPPMDKRIAKLRAMQF